MQQKIFKSSAANSIQSTERDQNDPASFGLPLEFKSNKSEVIQYKKDENDMDYDDGGRDADESVWKEGRKWMTDR